MCMYGEHLWFKLIHTCMLVSTCIHLCACVGWGWHLESSLITHSFSANSRRQSLSPEPRVCWDGWPHDSLLWVAPMAAFRACNVILYTLAVWALTLTLRCFKHTAISSAWDVLQTSICKNGSHSKHHCFVSPSSQKWPYTFVLVQWKQNKEKVVILLCVSDQKILNIFF